MIAAVADTQTALWHLFNDGRLSVAAGDFIDKSAIAGSQIVVSSISLAEIVYLIEKNRLPANARPKMACIQQGSDLAIKVPDCAFMPTLWSDFKLTLPNQPNSYLDLNI